MCAGYACSAMSTSYARSGKMGCSPALTISRDPHLWLVPAILGMQTGPCCRHGGISPVLTLA